MENSSAPSILDFDEEAVKKLEECRVNELNSVDLLKLLVVRGKDQTNLNPVLTTGCSRTLKMLARERFATTENKHKRSKFKREKKKENS